MKQLSSLKDNFPLYPFQREGVEFLLATKTAILGYEPGLGKSLTAIAATHFCPHIKRTLILCPAILKAQWHAELKKWLPNASISVIGGNPQKRTSKWLTEAPVSSYTIANYELLLRDAPQFFALPWDCIIADEATFISNRRAQRSQVLYKLPSAYRFALTGTPITNSPTDIFGIFKFINPGYLGTWTSFIKRYAILNQWFQPDYFQNLDELAHRVAPYLMRKTMEQVRLDIPSVIEADRVVEFSEKEKQLYANLRQELLHELVADGTLDKIEHPVTIQNALVKLTRLRQAADSFELLGQQTASSKLEAVRELLFELQGMSVLIFTEFSSMARLMQRELAVEAITGETLDVERQELLSRFTEGQISCLVLTRASQYGLNLQAAQAIIHYDQPWSLAAMQQRVGRARRIGQTRAVLVYHLLVKSSVDFYIKRVLRAKQKTADVVLGSDVTAMLEG